MKLTHEQVTRLQELFRSFSGVMGEEYSEDEWLDRFGLFSSGYQNGFKDGAEAMRERCADLSEYWDWRKSGEMTNEHIARAIHALPLDIDNKGGR